MHIGHSNPQTGYVMYCGGPPIMLDTTGSEKDLGVHGDANLTFEHHVEIVVNKADRMFEGELHIPRWTNIDKVIYQPDQTTVRI